jgi:carnosine N-methyltransferase
MHISTYLSRFLYILLCVAVPLYLGIRGSDSSFGTDFLFSSLSERAKALHVALTSPLAAHSAPNHEAPFQASVEPENPVRAPGEGRGKRYPSVLAGLAHCINSFEQYPFLAEQVLQRKYARYSKQTPAQMAISKKLGYPAHFEKARRGIEVNAQFSEKIAQIARGKYDIGPLSLNDNEDAEFGVIDSAFSLLSRDWSTQGAKERQAVFPPILSALGQHFGGTGGGSKVLVPGSGMGRLASDLADIGVSIQLH